MSNADNKITKPFRPSNDETGGGSSVTYLAPSREAVAHLPAGYPLRKADFIRRKENLILRAPDYPEIIVPRFFSTGGQATLLTGDGIEVSRHMVLLMANMSQRVEIALSMLAGPGGE